VTIYFNQTYSAFFFLGIIIFISNQRIINARITYTQEKINNDQVSFIIIGCLYFSSIDDTSNSKTGSPVRVALTENNHL